MSVCTAPQYIKGLRSLVLIQMFSRSHAHVHTHTYSSSVFYCMSFCTAELRVSAVSSSSRFSSIPLKKVANGMVSERGGTCMYRYMYVYMCICK